MVEPSHHKIKAHHLQRKAYLYVRQSSMRQVLENTESTKRQYELRERALALGWQSEQIHVIDCDQGRSGATEAGRNGFQHLVAEVSLCNAGIVMGLEVSRLARKPTTPSTSRTFTSSRSIPRTSTARQTGQCSPG